MQTRQDAQLWDRARDDKASQTLILINIYRTGSVHVR